jgi:Domain of unknown function (DUF5666)
MRKRVSSIFAISVFCAVLGAAVFAVGAQAAVRHFDATVISKSSAAKTVQVRTESGAKLTFQVNGRTKFERIGGGFSGLTKGLAVEIDANNASGQWVATQIEAASGNSGGDDSGGDDHGGHGGGNDDGPNHT